MVKVLVILSESLRLKRISYWVGGNEIAYKPSNFNKVDEFQIPRDIKPTGHPINDTGSVTFTTAPVFNSFITENFNAEFSGYAKQERSGQKNISIIKKYRYANQLLREIIQR